MKTKLELLAACLLLSTFNVQLSILHAQGTTFTYQGRLTDSAIPANGSFDFRFRLAADPLGNNYVGSAYLTNGIPVSNGLFTTAMDFGGAINGSNYWLEVDVRTNGAGGYTALAPLQNLTPSPYAMFAGTAGNLSGILPSGQLAGTYSGAVTLNNANNSFSGGFIGNGANVTNVNAATLGGLGASQFWKTGGNSNTVAGVNFLGTADNQPLELWVNGQRALRLEPTTNAPNLIGGFGGNYVTNAVKGAFIGGGGASVVFGASGLNRVTDDFGVVVGGADNRAGNTNADPTDAYYATVGGGVHNVAEEIATFIGGGAENRAANNNSTIAGGYQNTNNGYISAMGGGRRNFIGDPADQSTIGGGAGNQIIGSELSTVASTIGGGFANIIQTNVSYSTIAGGAINVIQEGSYEAAISGGYLNVILTNSPYCAIGGGYGNHAGGVASIVPGGYQSEAPGSYSFAAGRQAKANHDGAFVWADSQAADFASTATNQFNVRVMRYRLTPDASGVYTNAPNVIGGSSVNSASITVVGATIGGGGGNTFYGTGEPNSVTADFGTVGGGDGNTAGGYSATVGGGENNTASGSLATVGGGTDNTASGYAATVTGGVLNTASGNYSVAAGFRAKAAHRGSFVWSDESIFDYSSGFANGFFVRCTGGARFVSAIDGSGNPTAGVRLLAGDTACSAISDRDAKKNFAPVDGETILKKLAAIPVQQWNYKWEADTNTPHLGPMAQDFKAAFYPGRDDKSIRTLEFDGVELAAIQGLNEKVESGKQKARWKSSKRRTRS